MPLHQYPGSFAYTPASGSVLSAGNNQNLHVDFTPTDTNNYNGASADVKINVLTATTSVSSAAQTPVTAGGIATDTATLAGGYNPTGSIIFTLYGPSDTAICSDTNKVFTSAPVTVNGNGDYVSLGYTTKAVGTYRWIAAYSGDTNNNGFKTKCGDDGETLTVNYIFNGFFPPIDMVNVNLFDTKKTPPTIPLKWYLADGNGPVSDTARFKGVFTQEVTCDFNNNNAQIPQLESSPGGSGLQTPVNGNWQFNWAIKKSYATHCKFMFVQFTNDQISQKVRYKFI